MKVIKRDGASVDYDRSKIVTAIEKANAEVPEAERMSREDIDAIISGIEAQKRQRILVEDIQDLVEQGLVERNKFHLAKTYIIYRYNRALVRKANTTDESILALLRNENKELAEENSNKNTMIAATQRDYIAGEVSRDLTRRILLPEHISKAHDEGTIHFHDADYFIQPIFNCCLINIGDMLENGTVMNGKLIESPKSFQVACTVVTQIISCVASNQYGGQSVDLRHLGRYLRKSREKFKAHVAYECAGKVDEATMDRLVDDQVRSELKNGVQTLQYQINTLMTTNGQSPFVTLFLNLQEGDPYIQENAMIIEEVLRQRLQGIKTRRASTSPPPSPSWSMCWTSTTASRGASTTISPNWPSSAPPSGCTPTISPPRKCGRTTRAMSSPPWAAGPSWPPGGTRRAITSSRAGSTRGWSPSTCPRSASWPTATRRSSGSCWRSGSSCASRPSCAGTTP